MIAKYNGQYYLYSNNSREQEIVTRDRNRTDSKFCEEDGLFYKSVTEEELSDIFNVRYYVEYDAKLDHTPLWWEVFPADYVDDGIYLVFAEGFLPDWEVYDKGVCRKHVKLTDIDHCKVSYVYKKKDGKVVEVTEESDVISVDEMLKLRDKYSKENL